MRCSQCVIENPDAASQIDDFHEKLAQCDECPLREGSEASPIVKSLVKRHQEAARVIRKLGGRARAAEAHARDLEGAIGRQEAKIQVLENFQKASAEAADTALKEKMALVEEKEVAIRKLGAPIIHVLEGVVVLPLIGELDAERAESMTTKLLEAVTRIGATHIVLDLTGISTLNSDIAELLGRVARAVRLLGTDILLTGMRAELARTVVTLDVEFRDVRTLPTLKDAVQLISRDKRRAR